MTNRTDFGAFADKALRTSARLWLLVALIGQWVFLYYISAVYGPSSLQGNFQSWSRNKFLIKGYVPGDTAGNLVFAAHALLAGVIAFGGTLQLLPQIRSRAMAFHRWNGRVFLVTSLGVSVSGLYMIWVRGATTSLTGSVAISLNAVVIIICAILAWRSALTHNVAAHRRWALRTFMVANGQWFFRVGLFAWIILNHGHAGAFFNYWGFGCYLLPLAVLEIYLRARENAAPSARFAMAVALIVCTLLTGLGILGVTNFMWRPLL
jgi:uncharacterized membrane protein